MNSVALSGNLTEDPKLVHHGERPICEMRLAVDNGHHPSTYINIRAFDEQAYISAEFLRKGSKMGVTGRLVYDEWRNAENKKRSAYSVIGRVEFLDPAPVRDGGQPNANADRAPVEAAA